jgi:hypothetical protein
LDPEARVWHVYNDESQIFDDDMMIESGDNLDILLVFVCFVFCKSSPMLTYSAGWTIF